jgi:hypothetical protein
MGCGYRWRGYPASGYETCAQVRNNPPRVRTVDDRSSVGTLNVIVMSVDSLAYDFSRFEIAGFFVDPPAMGLTFSICKPQPIPLVHAGQKKGGHEHHADGCRENFPFGEHRFHGATHSFGAIYHVWLSAWWG